MHNSALIIALLGLTAAVSWGISDFLAAKSAKSIGPILASTLVNVTGAVLFAVVFLLFFRGHTQIPAIGFWYTVVSAIFLSAGAASFFVALDAGPVSIVSPLTSMYPLATTAVALLLYHAHLSLQQICGIVLTICGVLAVSGLITARAADRRLGKGPLFGLLTALFWGLGYALIAQALKHADWQIVSLVEFGVVTATFIVIVPFIKGTEEISVRSLRAGLANPYVLGASAIQLLGVVALDIGISKSTASGGAVITAISACYPILTIFLALRNFDEKIRLVPLAGAALGIVGVVVLSLG